MPGKGVLISAQSKDGTKHHHMPVSKQATSLCDIVATVNSWDVDKVTLKGVDGSPLGYMQKHSTNNPDQGWVWLGPDGLATERERPPGAGFFTSLKNVAGVMLADHC
jgi:hypothetical protein